MAMGEYGGESAPPYYVAVLLIMTYSSMRVRTLLASRLHTLLSCILLKAYTFGNHKSFSI